MKTKSYEHTTDDAFAILLLNPDAMLRTDHVMASMINDQVYVSPAIPELSATAAMDEGAFFNLEEFLESYPNEAWRHA